MNKSTYLQYNKSNLAILPLEQFSYILNYKKGNKGFAPF